MTRKGWILFIAMSVIWGIPYLFIKIALLELTPGVVVFARVGIAALILIPIAIYQGVLLPLRKRWLMIAGLACVQIVGPFLLISFGEQHITSSLTSLLIATDPILVALLALRFAPGERVTGMRLVGLLIGIVGVAVLLGFDVGGDGQKLIGAAMVLLAALGYAASALLIRRPTISALPSLGVVSVMCLTATIVLLPLAVLQLPKRYQIRSNLQLARARLDLYSCGLSDIFRTHSRSWCQPWHGHHICKSSSCCLPRNHPPW